MNNDTLQTGSLPWWGDLPFNLGETICWDFASLRVSILHLEKEWCVWEQHSDEQDGDTPMVPTMTRHDQTIARPEKFARFVFTRTHEQLSVLPNLPDRNVVAKPRTPITLMPGQEVTLFVGAVLWFSVRTLKGELFYDVPLRRLSDTWFGPSPQVGELCYASRTHAIIDPQLLSHRSYRAIVPITIRNENLREPLVIEKINVPVTLLELYYTKTGQFWTNSIYLLKEAGSSHVEIKIDSARRSTFYSVKESVKLAEPRKPEQHRLILRAYDMLFS